MKRERRYLKNVKTSDHLVLKREREEKKMCKTYSPLNTFHQNQHLKIEIWQKLKIYFFTTNAFQFFFLKMYENMSHSLSIYLSLSLSLSLSLRSHSKSQISLPTLCIHCLSHTLRKRKLRQQHSLSSLTHTRFYQLFRACLCLSLSIDFQQRGRGQKTWSFSKNLKKMCSTRWMLHLIAAYFPSTSPVWKEIPKQTQLRNKVLGSTRRPRWWILCSTTSEAKRGDRDFDVYGESAIQRLGDDMSIFLMIRH